MTGGLFFAVGSAAFCWLLLRGRMIPAWLAWLGLLASVMWVIGFPLIFVRLLAGPATYVLWIPMAVFEVTLAFWLILRGVAPGRARIPAGGAKAAG